MNKQPGPIPKRSDEKVRRNLPDVPVDKVTVIGVVPIPELDLGVFVHPLIADLYESLKTSGQAKYYEPSDWATARLAMYLANEMLTTTGGKPISSMKITAVNQMLSTLLMTEGDRRRVRLEVERNPSGGDNPVTPMSDLYRRRLAQA